MKKTLVFIVGTVVSTGAAAQSTGRYLVSDPTDVARVTHCVYTRPSTPSPIVTEHPVEVVPTGKRCKIDLVSMNDPRTGTVTVAFKDSALQEVGPSASFTFLVPIPGATGLRVSN